MPSPQEPQQQAPMELSSMPPNPNPTCPYEAARKRDARSAVGFAHVKRAAASATTNKMAKLGNINSDPSAPEPVPVHVPSTSASTSVPPSASTTAPPSASTSAPPPASASDPDPAPAPAPAPELEDPYAERRRNPSGTFFSSKLRRRRACCEASADGRLGRHAAENTNRSNASTTPGPLDTPEAPVRSSPTTPPSRKATNIPHKRRPLSPTMRPPRSILKKTSRWATLTTPQSDPSGDWHSPMAIFPYSPHQASSSSRTPPLSAGVSSDPTSSSSTEELFRHNPVSSSKSEHQEQEEEVQGKGKGKAKDQTVRITTFESVSDDEEIIRMEAPKPKTPRVRLPSGEPKVKTVRFAGVASTPVNKEATPTAAPKAKSQGVHLAKGKLKDKLKGQKVRLVSAESGPSDKKIKQTKTKTPKSKAQTAPPVVAGNTRNDKEITKKHAPKSEGEKKAPVSAESAPDDSDE
ncbi:hypothetical protein CIB48_g1777 [Xylaria polymorpha]|nr:hypothetical protein CIB48_g1777 [Xylaria polymorpha]